MKYQSGIQIKLEHNYVMDLWKVGTISFRPTGYSQGRTSVDTAL